MTARDFEIVCQIPIRAHVPHCQQLDAGWVVLVRPGLACHQEPGSSVALLVCHDTFTCHHHKGMWHTCYWLVILCDSAALPNDSGLKLRKNLELRSLLVHPPQSRRTYKTPSAEVIEAAVNDCPRFLQINYLVVA